MKKIILIMGLFLFLLPGGSQEPESKDKVSNKEKKEQKEEIDSTKMDSIFKKQKQLEMTLDSSLIKIKQQNAVLEAMNKQGSE